MKFYVFYDYELDEIFTVNLIADNSIRCSVYICFMPWIYLGEL